MDWSTGMAEEQTYTYTLVLSTETPYVGTGTKDEVALGDYGYSDQEWDALTERQRNACLDEWAEDNFWNEGYGYSGEVRKNG